MKFNKFMKVGDVKISVNLNDIKAIERAEKQKEKLENEGYSLVDEFTYTSFNRYNATYRKIK